MMMGVVALSCGDADIFACISVVGFASGVNAAVAHIKSVLHVGIGVVGVFGVDGAAAAHCTLLAIEAVESGLMSLVFRSVHRAPVLVSTVDLLS